MDHRHHGGGAFGGGSADGSGLAEFRAGDPFTTEAGHPSRIQSSWLFGDGAALFNQVIAQLGPIAGQSFTPIVPLDPVLRSAGVTRPAGGSVGVRVGRRLSSRFGAEFSFDRSFRALTPTDAAAAAIEASRASFASAFRDLLATAPVTGLLASATADLPGDTGHQTSFTGALTIALTAGRLGTYATAGAGVLLNGGGLSEARIRGNYQFRLFNVFAVNETDFVMVRFEPPGRAAIGVVGGGFTYDVSARHGVRVDARVLLGRGGINTSVRAVPSVPPIALTTSLSSETDPGLQISTAPGVRTTLSGGTTEFRTFTGTGIDARVDLTVGYFFRF